MGTVTPTATLRAVLAEHPAASAPELARLASERLGKRVSRQLAEYVLTRPVARPQGRPSTGARVLLRERDVAPAVLELARQVAARDGCAVADVVRRWLNGKVG